MRLPVFLLLLMVNAQVIAVDHMNISMLELTSMRGIPCFLGERTEKGPRLLNKSGTDGQLDQLGNCDITLNLADLRQPVQFCTLSGTYVETPRGATLPDSHGCTFRYSEDGKSLIFSSHISNNARVSCTYHCYIDQPQNASKNARKP